MKIVFTGGGTAGHVIPNIALIEELKGKNSLFYIGADGLEKQLLKPYIENQSLRFFSIEAHKLVRSLTPKNLLLPVQACQKRFSSQKAAFRNKARPCVFQRRLRRSARSS